MNEVTYGSDHISLTLSNVLNFVFIYFVATEKKKIRRSINSNNKNIYAWNQHYYYFDLPKIRVGQARTTKNQVALA